MDFEGFCKLLINSNSSFPNEQAQSHEILMQFRENDYFQFMTYTLMLLQNFSNQNLAILSITLIYNEVKSGKIHENPEFEKSFLEKFLLLIPNIFQSPIPDNFKILASLIISYIAVKRYNELSETTIQEYLLYLYKTNPSEFETYVINSIMEIIVSCQELGGFNTEIIMYFLSSQLQKESSFIPRCKLFFAVAMHFPEDEKLRYLFENLYLNMPIPPQFLHDFFNVIIAFSENSALFFQPHIESGSLMEFLKRIIKDVGNPERHMALYLFESLAIGAPEMCQTLPQFCQTVIQCFFEVISENSQSIPTESYDTNDLMPHSIAREVLCSIMKICIDTSNFMQFACQICIEISRSVGGSLLALPWNVAYSIMAIFSDLQHNVTSISCFIDRNPKTKEYDHSRFLQFIEMTVPLLSTPDICPMLKYEAVNFFSKKTVISTFSFDHGLYPLQFIKQIIVNDENLIIKKKASQALEHFFVSISIFQQYLMPFYPTWYEEIKVILSQSPPILFKPLIKVLSCFVSLYGFSLFNDYFGMLLGAYSQSEYESPIKLELINIILDFLSKSKINLYENPNYAGIPAMLINDLVQIANVRQIDEYNDDEIYSAVVYILETSLGNVSNFALSILPRAFEKSKEEIQIFQIHKLEKIDQSSLYIELPETQSNLRSFALISDINSVNRALHIIILIIKNLGKNSICYINSCIEIIQYWITNQFQIDDLKFSSWEILNSLIAIFSDEPTVLQFVDILFDDFKLTIEAAPIEVGNKSVRTMKDFLQYNIPFSIDDKIPDFLINLNVFLNKCIEQLNSIIESYDRFQCDHQDLKESNYQFYFSSISEVYCLLLDKYPAITLSFMETTGFIERVKTLLASTDFSQAKNLHFAAFSFEVITAYIKKVNNLENALNWIEILIQSARKPLDNDNIRFYDIYLLTFKYMVEIFKAFKLPPEIAINFQNEFDDLFELIDYDTFYKNNDEGDDEASEEKAVFFDWALPAFAFFAQANKDVIDFDSALNTFFENFSSIEACEISNYSFALIVDLFKEKNPIVFSEQFFYDLFKNMLSFIDNTGNIMTNETHNEFKKVLLEIVCDPVYGPKAIEIILNEARYFDGTFKSENLEQLLQCGINAQNARNAQIQ